MARRGDALKYFNDVVLKYDGEECLPWPFSCNKYGYGRIRYNGQVWLVSRLVCTLTLGPAPTPMHQAAHSCGMGHDACSTKRHLSWKTRTENEADKVTHETDNRGERSAQSKLTAADVVKIRAMKGVVPQSTIAAQFNVGRENISAIHRGRSWSWLP